MSHFPNASASTDRGLTLTDSATINTPSGITSFKGIIKGSGTLIKSGSGQLNITYDGTNTWSGGTILKSGKLAMGTWRSTFGSIGSKIVGEGGSIAMFDNNNTSAVPSFNYNLEVPEGKSIVLYAGSRCTVSGSFTGNGTITVNFPYVRGDFKTEMKNFYGTLKVTGNQFRLNQATNMSNSTLNLGDGLYMAHFASGSGNEQNQTTQLGGLTSTGSCNIGTGTYKVGYLGNNDSFSITSESKKIK